MRRHPKPTRYTPRNPEKYVGDPNAITMRSTWERKFAIWCDNNPSVLRWNSEGIPIEYWHSVDMKVRRYFVDFFVEMQAADGSIKRFAIEVKPKAQTMPPVPPKRKTMKAEQRYITEAVEYQRNCDKWNAARQWCKRNGFEFVIMTEDELGIKVNKI